MKKTRIEELNELLNSNGFNNYTIERNNKEDVYKEEKVGGVPILKISESGYEQYIIKLTIINSDRY